MKKTTIPPHNFVGNIFGDADPTAVKPGILFIHGWESKQDRGFSLLEACAEYGYVGMSFDMRGHGATGGDISTLSRADFLADCLSAYDYLAATPGVDPARIYIAGSSFGSYMAALVAHERPVAGLVLRVPANYRDEGFTEPLAAARIDESHTAWKREVRHADATRSLRALAAYSGPVLIVESEHDEQVPQAVLTSYRTAAKPEHLTYTVMRGAPHSISHHPELQARFTELVVTWLREKTLQNSFIVV